MKKKQEVAKPKMAAPGKKDLEIAVGCEEKKEGERGIREGEG